MCKRRSVGQAGFTLLEVLAALGILAFAIAVASSSLVLHLKANAEGEISFEAAQAAQTVIDELRFQDVSEMPTEGTDSVRQISVKANHTFDVYVSYCEDATYCTSSDVRHIAVQVQYKNESVYRTETVFTALEKGNGSTDEAGDGEDPLWETPTPTPTPTPTSTPGGGGGGRCRWWRC